MKLLHISLSLFAVMALVLTAPVASAHCGSCEEKCDKESKEKCDKEGKEKCDKEGKEKCEKEGKEAKETAKEA
ncbi:MAG: hypothetical protein AAF571_01885 [Verrucomicrobiota bacterium]